MPTSLNSNALEVRDVYFRYERNHDSDPLFRGFSLSILKGTVVAVMGPSGSGKSTLGRMIAQMLQPQNGSVSWAEDFTRRNDLVYIDQQAMNCVFPWQRVRRNIEYPLRKLKWRSGEVSQRADQMLNLFKLDHLAEAFPANLSGGELQRLSVARVLAWKPRCAVLDESFSALDARTKEEILIAVRRLADTEKMTMVLITHNLGDALAVADRCVLVGRRPVEISVRLQAARQLAQARNVPVELVEVELTPAEVAVVRDWALVSDEAKFTQLGTKLHTDRLQEIMTTVGNDRARLAQEGESLAQSVKRMEMIQRCVKRFAEDALAEQGFKRDAQEFHHESERFGEIADRYRKFTRVGEQSIRSRSGGNIESKNPQLGGPVQ